MNPDNVDTSAPATSDQSAWRNVAAEQGQRTTPLEIVVAAILLVLSFIVSTVPIWGGLLVLYLLLRWFGVAIP